jgi:hypothetical protein
MSLIGTVANYGGKQPDNSQNIKQFVVGINSISTASWIYKTLPSGLQVQTPANAIKPVYISSDLYVNGSIYNTSDKIFKENIETMSKNKTMDILNLNPVEFTFKSDLNKKLHYGFIAQEVEQIYPELVKDSDLGYKTVNYIEFIPILVSKIKNMQNEIDNLKQQIGVKNIDI